MIVKAGLSEGDWFHSMDGLLGCLLLKFINGPRVSDVFRNPWPNSIQKQVNRTEVYLKSIAATRHWHRTWGCYSVKYNDGS